MAKLEDLYPNFLTMSDEEMREFFYSYAARRAEDIANSNLIAVKKKPSSKDRSTDTPLAQKVKKISVTAEQADLLRKLGLLK